MMFFISYIAGRRTGQHKYVFLLFKGDPKLFNDLKNEFLKKKDRGSFKTMEWANRHNLKLVGEFNVIQST